MASGAMKVAGAVAVGYLLGRTRKMRLALGVTAWLVAKNVNRAELIRRLASSDLARSLVTEPITARADRMADALSQRTAVLQQGRAGPGTAGQDGPEAEETRSEQPQGETPKRSQPAEQGERDQGEAASARREQGGRQPGRREPAGREVEDARQPQATAR